MANAYLNLKCSYLLPVVAFSYHYEMKIVSVIMIRNPIHYLSVNFRCISLIEQKI